MEVVKTNIYQLLKRNNLVVWVVVVCSGLISIFAIWTVRKVSANAERYVYTISSNEQLLPLEQIEKKEVETIYRKSHVKLFLEHFYGYDQWNYKKRIEKALWLIDTKEGEPLFNQYVQSGHYNNMQRTTSSQTIYEIKPKIVKNNNFMVNAIIEINHSKQERPKKYQFSARGKLEKVSENYPLNPYGYLIKDYKEITLKEIKDE